MQYNPINKQGGISPRTKAYLQIGLFIGIGYVIYRVVKKEVQLQKLRRELGNESTLTNNELGNTGGIVLSACGNYNPAPDAEALRDAIKSDWYNPLTYGTDEQAIWRTLMDKTCWQKNCIRNYFNRMYGDGATLMQWFEGDLSGALLAKAKGYFNCVEEPLEG
tara:strand:- start:190 stop:678 length:489 start_codon:yes stop_codon:yes gene_type:complete